MKDYLKQIQQDVDEMNKGLSGELPGTDAPGTESVSTELPGTESPGTEAPGTELPNTDAPATESPTTDPPKEEDEKDKIIENLRKRLDEKEKGSSPKTEAPTTDAPISFEPLEFISEEDIEGLMDDPKRFNKFLNDFREKIILESRKILGEGVLRSIPEIVKTNIKLNADMQKASDDFFSKNKDLKPFRRVVAAVFEEMSADNPDKTYDEILKDVGPEARRRLDLQEQAKQKNDDNPPKLPKKVKGRGPKAEHKPKTSEIESEIAEMNKHLGGNN